MSFKLQVSIQSLPFSITQYLLYYSTLLSLLQLKCESLHLLTCLYLSLLLLPSLVVQSRAHTDRQVIKYQTP